MRVPHPSASVALEPALSEAEGVGFHGPVPHGTSDGLPSLQTAEATTASRCPTHSRTLRMCGCCVRQITRGQSNVKTGDRRDVREFPFVETLGNVPSVPIFVHVFGPGFRFPMPAQKSRELPGCLLESRVSP